MENKIGSIWNKWDLHIHTDASDGKGSCQEILNEAAAKQIKCIAITDHHTVANVDVMKSLAALQGCVIPLWCFVMYFADKKIINVYDSYKLTPMISLVCHK